MYNILGRALPAVVGLVSVPIILKHLGADRFGLLSLMWVVVGYFSIFDLGLGRALTQAVAERRARGRSMEVPALIWTSLSLLLALSVLATISIACASPWIVEHALKVPVDLRKETTASFLLLSLSMPFVILTAALRGVLEAQRAFGLVNALRTPMVVATFLGPLAILPFSRSLVAVVGALLAGRVITFVGHWLVCRRSVPSFRVRPELRVLELKPLLRFGGWITVSNILGPLMVNFDRVIIGGQIAVAAIGYYATAQQVVSQALVIPAAYAGVLFPIFAENLGARKPGTTEGVFRAVLWAVLLTLPPLLIMSTFAREGLNLWIGHEFAERSYRILQILCVGALFNGLAQVPFTLIQSAGRADLTAKLHSLEVVPYLALVWWLTRSFGVTGTAVAWTVRMGLDMALMFLVCGALLERTRKLLRVGISAAIVATCVLVPAVFIPWLALRGLYVCAAAAGLALEVWRHRLSRPSWKDQLRSRVPSPADIEAG